MKFKWTSLLSDTTSLTQKKKELSRRGHRVFRLVAGTCLLSLPWILQMYADMFGWGRIEIPDNLFFDLLGYGRDAMSIVLLAYVIHTYFKFSQYIEQTNTMKQANHRNEQDHGKQVDVSSEFSPPVPSAQRHDFYLQQAQHHTHPPAKDMES